MAETYPASLPLAQRQGRDYQLVSPLVRSSMGNGRAIQRRAFTDVPVAAKVSWLFNDVQVQAFELWFRYKINDGASWFEMPLRHPLGLRNYVCRFTGVYTGPSAVPPNLWSISAELELRERPLADASEADFLDDVVYSGILDVTINIELPSPSVSQ